VISSLFGQIDAVDENWKAKQRKYIAFLMLTLRIFSRSFSSFSRFQVAVSTKARYSIFNCIRKFSSVKDADNASSNGNEAKTVDMEKQLAELKDGYLRCLADMENLRQRSKRDVESASQFAIQNFCQDLIGVLDVLEMALSTAGPGGKPLPTEDEEENEEIVKATPEVSSEEKKLQDLVDGLSMTMAEMHKALARHGVTVTDPLYQKFDPNLHNALFEVPSEDVDPGTIVNVQKKGYFLNGRVIRPAYVGIARRA